MNKKNKEFGIVSGAAGFLGEVHCESVLDFCDGLIMLDINKKRLNQSFIKLNKKYKNRNIYKFSIDVSKENLIKKIFRKLKKDNCFIRVLINNACIDPKPNSIKKNKLTTTWQRELDVGLKSAYLLTEYFSKNMITKKRGCIINIASDLSVIAPNQSIYKGIYKNFNKPVTYSIIKHGLVGLTKYYAAMLAKHNITCNAISPSGVYNSQSQKFVKKLTKLIPMGRMATKSDIKNTIDFLINKNQKFITGQNILIDGGRTIV